jgi:5-methyltetrahydropteroyltriglutamate--homocysteine methyltransferase
VPNNNTPFMTTVVGSMPKRQWLYKLTGAKNGSEYRYGKEGAWTLDGEALARAKDDAARVAIRVQERAGIDIVSDGEQRREHYLTHLTHNMEGFDYRELVEKSIRGGRSKAMVGQCVGDIKHTGAITVDDLAFLQSEADRPVKVTLPGPMTVVDSTFDAHYGDEKEMAFAWADAINQEARLLDALGPAMIQFDEPTFSRYPDKVEAWGIEALNRCVDGIKSDTIVHVCYGYPRAGSPNRPIVDSYPTIIAALDKSRIDILALEFEGANLDPALLKACPSKKVMFGCVFNSDSVMETPRHVAGRLLKAAESLPPEQILAAPDCGLAPMSFDTAAEKLDIMVKGAALAREQVS